MYITHAIEKMFTCDIKGWIVCHVIQRISSYLFFLSQQFSKFSNNTYTTSFCNISGKHFPSFDFTLLRFLELIKIPLDHVNLYKMSTWMIYFSRKKKLFILHQHRSMPTYIHNKKIYFTSWLTHCSTGSTVILVPFPFDKGIFQHRCFSLRINPCGCARLCNDLFYFISNTKIYIYSKR